MNTHDDTIAGVLIVDKAKGMTSHDVVNLVRRRFSVKKVGHAGTLDPQATGVLVLLVGGATKLSEKFSGEDKEYDAVMKLGERTDSGDSQGKVISVRDVGVTEEQIREAVMSFMGGTEQIPPMVSAKKIDGIRLYKLARKGIEVEREPIKISIREMEISGINIPFVKFRVLCSKGTYIRQLAEDIGEKLGCGAHLTELRRTRSGAFAIHGALTVDRLNEMDKETFRESIARI